MRVPTVTFMTVGVALIIALSMAQEPLAEALEAEAAALEPPSWWVGSRSRRGSSLDDVLCGRGGNGPTTVRDMCAATGNRRRRGNRDIPNSMKKDQVCNFKADSKGCFYFKDACEADDEVGELFRAACPATCGLCEPRKICNMKFDDSGCYANIKLVTNACDNSYILGKCPAGCHVEGCPQPQVTNATGTE